MEYDYIFVGSSPSVFGFIEGLHNNKEKFTAIILEKGTKEEYLSNGNPYYHKNYVTNKKDKCGKIIREPNVFGGGEILDDHEFSIKYEHDYDQRTIYNYDNFYDAFIENNFNELEKEHEHTVLYDSIKEIYNKNDITSFYSTHSSQIRSKKVKKTKKKKFFKDCIKNKEHIEYYTNCMVNYIKLENFDGLYKAVSVICYHNGTHKTFKARKDIIIGTGCLDTCELLKNSGISENGSKITNKNIGRNINCELEYNLYYQIPNNKLTDQEKELKNNSLYYKLDSIFNLSLFIFIFGFSFAWLFTFLYGFVFHNEWLKNFFFISTGITDGFILSWVGFNFLWLTAYLLGTISSVIYFTFHGMPVIQNLTSFVTYYWIAHTISNLFTTYYFCKKYINPGSESLVGLKSYFNNYYQKITVMTNLDYKFIRSYFSDYYNNITRVLILTSNIFGFRYLFFNKIVLIKNITSNYGKNGTYLFHNGKWTLNLNINKNDQRIEDFYNEIKENLKLLEKLNINRISPFYTTRKFFFSNCEIYTQLTGSCVMASNIEDGVVDVNNGLLVFGTTNLRIISSACYPKTVKNSSTLFFYLFGYITSNFILNK